MEIIASVIIPIYDDGRLKRCLRALSRQIYNREKFEVLVIENGPLCQFRQLALNCGARYFYLPEKNMAKARNIGLKNALGKYVLFTDSDCVPNQDWVKTMVHAFSNSDCIGFGGQIKRYDPKTKIERLGKNLAWGQRKLQYLQILDLPYVVFANSGFVKQALIEVGGFDPKLLSGNDVDVCWKLGLKKYKIGICQSVIVFHENRKTLKDYFKTYLRYAKYQSLLFKKYQPITKRRFMINTYAIKLFLDALSRLGSLLKGNPRPWYDIVEAIAIIIGHIHGSICFKTFYI